MSTATIERLLHWDSDFVESQIQIDMPMPTTASEFYSFLGKCREVSGDDGAILVSIDGVPRDVVARRLGVPIGQIKRLSRKWPDTIAPLQPPSYRDPTYREVRDAIDNGAAESWSTPETREAAREIANALADELMEEWGWDTAIDRKGAQK